MFSRGFRSGIVQVKATVLLVEHRGRAADHAVYRREPVRPRGRDGADVAGRAAVLRAERDDGAGPEQAQRLRLRALRHAQHQRPGHGGVERGALGVRLGGKPDGSHLVGRLGQIDRSLAGRAATLIVAQNAPRNCSHLGGAEQPFCIGRGDCGPGLISSSSNNCLTMHFC